MISTSHLHPMLVHFPIALIIVGFMIEAVSLYWKKRIYLPDFSFYLLLTGTLAAIFTLLSGTFFTSEMSGSAQEIQEIHELFAWISVGLLVGTLVFRIIIKTKHKETGLKWVAFVLYGLATVSVSVTGFYGGTLVYNYMMPL
jgi:uncharacterized membrane protein